MSFDELPAGTLELRMSRSSPGRYALHEFAKNVFDVRVTDAGGQTRFRSSVRTRTSGTYRHTRDESGSAYRIYGDRVDGTYLGIDSTHAHINMPAALMWARGLEKSSRDAAFRAAVRLGLARRNAAHARR